MTFSNLCNDIFWKSTTDYHVTDSVDAPMNNPYELKTIEYYLYLKNWIDAVQWHFEDIIRDPQIDPVLDVYKLLGEKYLNFHLCFDMGHAHCYSKIPVLEWTEKLAPYVTHVHVHDNSGDRDSHAALGEGNIPYEKVLALLPQTEKRTWTIECCRKEDVLQTIKILEVLKK